MGAIALVLTLLTFGCSLLDPSGDAYVDETTPIVTDTYVYQLQEEGSWYSVRFRTRYINTHDTPVFLYRRCGYGDLPAKRLVRADSSSTPISLREGSCARLPPSPPIEFPAGDTLFDEFVFLSYKWAEDPVEWMSGRFRLEYFIQASDKLADSPMDLIAFDARISNAFAIDPF